MKGLRVMLVVMGILCVVSCAPGAVAPWSTINHGFQVLGYESLPDRALVVYGVRQSSLWLALMGVFFLVLAADPMRYRPMLVLTVCGLFLTAALSLAAGLLTHMQPPWYLFDFAACLAAAVLILALWPRPVETPATE